MKHDLLLKSCNSRQNFRFATSARSLQKRGLRMTPTYLHSDKLNGLMITSEILHIKEKFRNRSFRKESLFIFAFL